MIHEYKTNSMSFELKDRIIFSFCVFWAVLFINKAQASSVLEIHEITMATPNVIRVEIREPEVKLGNIVKLNKSVEASRSRWTILPDGRTGAVIGPKRNYFRLEDTAELKPLDRQTIDQAEKYGAIGGRRVVAVYRKSVPWSTGYSKNGYLVSFAHFVFLKLDSPLSPGAYTIAWPLESLRPTHFTFDDNKTRASAIRATQLGHRPSDISKHAYLALWLPNGPRNGSVDFRRYGIDRFQVVDDRGKPVFTGRVKLRTGPLDPEPGNGISAGLITYKRADGSQYKANRAATFVFDLDYSAWQSPKPGTYRIRIAGLGVSDPFEIADDVWRRAAQVSLAGLYHQRSGLKLDGRFGYHRPECLTEASGVTVYQSKLPFAMSGEGGGFVPFSEAAKRPWITGEIVSDAWGGYHDAGDWDRRIQHLSASYMLLDLFELLPEVVRNTSFGIPESSEVLPHPAYRDRKLPDIVDEAIWNIDFFRRLQRSDGAVSGGVESSGGPSFREPCWLESKTLFSYAPDPSSTYAYAAAAAKLAIVLKSIEERELSDLYAASALRAWNWAAQFSSEPRKAYAEAIRLLGGFKENQETRFLTVLRIQSGHRLWAAATLHRLNGKTVFRNAVEDEFKMGLYLYGSRFNAGWEYLIGSHSGRSEDLLEQIRSNISTFAERYIVKPQAKWAYKSLKHRDAPMRWGAGLAPNLTEIGSLIRAHSMGAVRDELLAAMLDGSAHILGANQMGMSFTIGLGHRWPKSPLHENSIAAGVPAPKGITVYGWADPAATDYWWLWGPKWAPLSNEVPTRRVEPHRTALPIFEYFIEHPRMVMSSEYTIHQTIATTAAMWIYLDGWNRK